MSGPTVSKKRKAFMQGNEAMAEGAFAAGARFYAGYPITPSSEIAEIASRRLLELGGIYIQMEDEIGSIAAVIGASMAGARAFTATSGPGFSLMQENLGVAVMAEVPCVVIDVQRSGPSTGLATRPAQADVMQARWGRHGDQAIIALSPSSVRECYSFTARAFALAERFRTPVVVLADEIVGHMRETIEIPDPAELEPVVRRYPTVPPAEYLPFKPGPDGVPELAEYGSEYIFHVTSSMHDETGYSNNVPENAERKIARIHRKIYDYKDEIIRVKSYDVEDAEIVLIAYGATARAARAAAREARAAGIRTGVLKLDTIWPFPDEQIVAALRGKRAALVPELNMGQVVLEARRAAGSLVPVFSLNKCNGEGLTPGEILSRLEEVSRCLK